MSGLLALLDDVAAIAKVAAASIDDIAAQAAKAGAKAAGAAIDDAAVTPRFVHGFEADRELPIVWRIAKGSIRNKLLILLPVAMLLSSFAPWVITPLLMLGGAYLCFEGAEKIYHAFFPHANEQVEEDLDVGDVAHLEEERVSGAIKTDFILSAEIMTIALAAIPVGNLMMQGATLAAVGVGITVLVYGGVALIVKADDFGLFLAEKGRLGVTRGIGNAIVRGMPGFLSVLTKVGTAAMLWVGGSIIVHGLETLGVSAPGHLIHVWSTTVGHWVDTGRGALEWVSKATLDGIFGLVVGLLLIPLVTLVYDPIVDRIKGKPEGTVD
jgi:predicted DNA repair protein MutK